MRWLRGLGNYLINTFKAEIMVLTIPIIIIAVAIVVGYTSHLITNKDDGEVEEAAEELIENELETTLHLPPGSKHIDLTPKSKEQMKET